MDAQEKLILQSRYSVGILATAQLNAFELVELTHEETRPMRRTHEGAGCASASALSRSFPMGG